MPHQGSRVAKTAKRPHPPAKGSSCPPVNGTSSFDYSTLKRTELQQQCKKLGLRATGKNAELVKRLKAYREEPISKTATVAEAANKTEECCQTPEALLTVCNPNVSKTVKTEPSEEKPDVVQGWCVVHGMALYRPSFSWAPLLLRGGLIYIQDGENLVPFHLPPLNTPVPNGLSDNYVCEDCVIRNREKPPKSCPLCHHSEGIGNQTGCSKRHSRIPIPLQLNTSQASLLQTSDTKDRRRTVEIRKLYQPQEDQAYAQRVDEILSRMARGELAPEMDRALRPLQPLVVHSPNPFSR
ncbi:developmental pluripotency-associated protein 2-like [Tiliqua scincoides]|uniref:developmental pluripotency-associated protein 2-like n=1 Tax=Tiliqua scincoides TaxID=71010 RepID=UPI0034627DF0